MSSQRFYADAFLIIYRKEIAEPQRNIITLLFHVCVCVCVALSMRYILLIFFKYSLNVFEVVLEECRLTISVMTQ